MMRQLEHALGLLAERAEPLPTDALIGRLEAQLATESAALDTGTGSEPAMSTGPTVHDRLGAGRRRSPWRGPLIAAGTAAAILVIVSLSLLLVGGGSGDVVIQPTPTTTTPTTPDAAAVVPTPMDATWSLQGTSDDWLTEPVLFNGEFYATRKGLSDDAELNVEGLVEGHVEEVGELWTSVDGVTWIPAEGGERPTPTTLDTPTDGAAVVVRRDPGGDLYGVLVADGLWATSDGSSWREIALRPRRDNWVPWVAKGGLGWVVYSPPSATTVEAGASSLHSYPRPGNLGLWYTPDTEAWFEVTDLGPLANTIHNVGEIGVIDTAMIVQDDDILVYAYIAKNSGFGTMGNPHTEIWRLDLSPLEPADLMPTSTPAVPTTAVVTTEEWNPILSTTDARSAPPAANCPSDANPDAAGPADQNRPEARWVGNLAGAFDQRAGRIVYVDVTGETWTFDVCTNTWHRVEPNGVPVPVEDLYDGAGEPSGALGQLVYDVDSDVTVSLGYSGVAVYTAATNTWERRAYPTNEMGAGPHGAVYDPVSGLVVTSLQSPDDPEAWDLWAYNVDTDKWTELGPITVDRNTPCCTQIDLLGYSSHLDRLILTT
ncbi:MAG: hypothetical protein U9N79_00300, partial [Actinomycetota bacterium]|nr:hypothetical protein [Actinomycetota bacterium]